MKIGITGCSHSARHWGNPWHHYMGLKLNAEIIESSSPGAGNEMNFEKIKFILDNNLDLNLFVVQLTEPGRLVMGLNNVDESLFPKRKKIDLNLPLEFNGSYYYTFNSGENNQNIQNLLKKNIQIDEFIINHTFTSDYNLKFKIFHTILGIQQLCNLYNVKVIFFSWMLDLCDLVNSAGYGNIIHNFNIIPGCVDEFVLKNNIERIPNDGHFNSENSERIYNEFIHNKLIKFL
jgi:hypothetical protein